jgi:hypothetical protein
MKPIICGVFTVEGRVVGREQDVGVALRSSNRAGNYRH